MSRIRPDKKISELEPFFENILICNDKKLRPFIEIFICEPENVAQQKLGILLGVFDFSDFSEDSSYIVNYLISIIKKEYFSKIKRGPIESFEAALHKANLALAKLAEHGSIGWIGKFNAIVAAIEKNNIHLSQSGTVSALLLRSKGLTEISEGLAPEKNELTPLKTFINVTSGRLEEDDKIIITTENIFNIFSFDEIKKSAINFFNEEFARFLKTALSNELDKAAVLLIDIKKKIEIPEPVRKIVPLNAFSQQTYSRLRSQPKSLERDFAESLKAEEEKEKQREKNGHLYIKEAEIPIPEQPAKTNEIWIETEEKMAILWKFFKRLARNSLESATNIVLKVKLIPWKIIFSVIGDLFAYLFTLIKKLFFKILNKKQPTGIMPENSEKFESISFRESFPQIQPEKKISILPNFQLLKNILSSMDYKKKIYVAIIIIAIFIIPYFIVRFEKNVKEKNEELISQQEIIPEIPLPLEQDKNVFRIENLDENYSGSNISKILNLNGKLFAISNLEVINLESSEKFAISEDLGIVDISCSMDDLNLILLINKQNKKIFSWSPTSKKFQSNNIIIPENAEISDVQTYLTYIYLIDSKNNQIYRYPRAEGGFGEKVDWKKDTTEIQNITGMAINENLFLADGKNILKFFHGKKQDFNIEETATPIAPLKLWTKRDSVNLYSLDKENSRIVKLDPNGAIISEFYNPEIADSIDFTVKESSNDIYFATPEKIRSFQMN